MNRSPAPLSEPELVSGLKANDQLAFSKLYDQYAALLLGVITKIVSDKTEAIALLQTTFATIRLQIDQYQFQKQPLFVWLLQIARSTAVAALKERRQIKVPVFQLTKTGEVDSLDGQKSIATAPMGMQKLADLQLKTLLDSILFKNCTPEEAAASLGIPAELARQQVRLAMQQLRVRARE